MSSESWGEYALGLIFLIMASMLFIWGSSGILRQELHWGDSSEYSTNVKGKFHGGTAVVLGSIIVILSLSILSIAIYFLSNLEWFPFSWVAFLRISILAVIFVAIVAIGIQVYRGKTSQEQKIKRKRRRKRGILTKAMYSITKYLVRKRYQYIKPKRYICPCCGYLTLYSRGDFEICPVCYWEDEAKEYDPDGGVRGPNPVSLSQARKNFQLFGAIDKEFIRHVRKPRYYEIPKGLKEISGLD